MMKHRTSWFHCRCQLSCRFSRPNRVDEALTTGPSDIIVSLMWWIVVCDATINKNAGKQHERRENRHGHDDDGRDSSTKNDQEGSETRKKRHYSDTYTWYYRHDTTINTNATKTVENGDETAMARGMTGGRKQANGPNLQIKHSCMYTHASNVDYFVCYKIAWY